MATEEVGLRLSLKERRETAKGLRDTAQDVENVGKASSRMGGLAKRGFVALGGGLATVGKWVGRGVLGVAAAGVGALGYALTRGFGRLTNIENATAKLEGLGHSGRRVDKIMENARQSVLGTAFGLDDAAGVASTAVAAGIKPGRELEKTLKLVADAATIGGSTMGEMGSIFNKVATSGKVQGDVINQLQDRNIGIVAALGKTLGKTGAEVTEMSRKGEIGFKAFRKAMKATLGGAALESGNTTIGALKNVDAAAGRLGASLLSGIFPTFKGVFKEMQIAVGGLEDRVDPFMRKMGRQFGPQLTALVEGSGEKFLGWVDRVIAGIPKAAAAFERFRSGGASEVGGTLAQLATAGGPALEFFSALTQAMGPAAGALGTLAGQALAAAVPMLEATAGALGWVAEDSGRVTGLLSALAAGFVIVKAAQVAGNIALAASIPLRAVEAVAMLRNASANKALARAQTQATLAQNGQNASTQKGIVVNTLARAKTLALAAANRVLNLVMRANPIGAVITVLALLVGGLVLAYKKSETFRGIVDKVWGALKVVGKFIAGVLLGYLKMLGKAWLTMGIFGIKAFRLLVTAAFSAFDGILSAAEKGLGWIPGIGDKVRGARRAFNDFGNSVIGKLEGVEGKLIKTRDLLDDVGRNRTATITYATNGTAPRGVLDATPRATGGPVAAGRPYVVGEKRPELFVPKVDGVILPRIPAAPSASDMGIDGDRAARLPDQHVHVNVDGRELFEIILNRLEGRVART